MHNLYEVILRIQYVYTDRGTYIHLTSFKVNNVNMIKKFFVFCTESEKLLSLIYVQQTLKLETP